MGTIVIPFLPAFSRMTPKEFRTRLERIEEPCSRGTRTITRPSRVTLLGTDDRSRCTRVDFSANGEHVAIRICWHGLDVGLNLDIDDMLFWEALDEVLDRLNLTILPDDERSLDTLSLAKTCCHRDSSGKLLGQFSFGAGRHHQGQRLYEPGLNTASIEFYSCTWETSSSPQFSSAMYGRPGAEVRQRRSSSTHSSQERTYTLAVPSCSPSSSLIPRLAWRKRLPMEGDDLV